MSNVVNFPASVPPKAAFEVCGTEEGVILATLAEGDRSVTVELSADDAREWIGMLACALDDVRAGPAPGAA